MKKFKELAEQKGLMVMAFGRMNPPTIGHLKLCDKVKSIAGSKPYRIYLSQTVGPKDPLPFPKKIAYAKKSFPKHARAIQVDKSIKTFIQAAQKINQEGYTELVMVAGSDRIQEFQRLLDTYNGKPDKKGNIVFDFPDGVKVVSSGERDPDSADPTEAISASVMRAAAQSGDFETFKKGSPMKESDAKKMYDDVRKFMGVREVKEDLDIRDDYDALRDLFVTGKIWNAGDIVEARGITGEVVRKGTNHLSFVDEDGKVHKAWLHEIELNETPIADLIGKIDAITHPKKYKSAMKKYASLMAKDRTKRKTTGALAHDAAREYNIDSKSLIKYINGLVKKGELPKALRAAYMPTFAESLELQESKPKRVKQDPDIKDSPGTEPAKYYAKDAKGKEMSKSTKQARDQHFAKGAAKDDDDPSAYKPAPGDKGAKTKLSKHTKKVRQMYPDLYKEEMIPYDVYCNLLDYIGENYHRLNDQTLTEDWWSDLSPSEQDKYIRDHPNSDKAKDAREKEKNTDSEPTSDKPSREKTQQALQDLKTHVGAVSKSVGVDAKVVAKAFKEPSVYNTVNALGGSLSAASKTIVGGSRAIGKALNIGGAAISDTESFKQLEKGVIKVDEFMDKNPALKRVAGATVAGIAAYQWLKMSFSGDVESDYDVSLISAGLAGQAGFADLINTPDGVKSMALLGAGLATGGLPIWMGGPVGLGMALAYTGAKKAGDTEAGKKIKKRMVEFGKKAQNKIQNRAKEIDRRLGVKTEEKMVLKPFSVYDEESERDYKKEYDNYHSKPEQVKRRSSRNKARRIMGDKAVKGKDIGHKDNNPMNNNPKNLRNEDPTKNRREPRLRENKAPDTSDAMKRYKAGKAGFTDIAHLKAKGLIPRSDGEKRKSDKYKDESLWANIHKKRQRIKQGSGERMRKKGEKGAPTPAQMQRAKSEEACCDDCGTDSTLIENNLYRVGSEAYYKYFEGMREKYEKGELEVSGFDKELMEGDIGKFAIYEKEVVPLECPLVEAEYQGKDVALNEPKAGGPKKYYVYVRDPSTGNVKKVSWGDTTGLKIKLDDKEARKSFAARHDCANKKDKTKAGYWACNMPRYADKLGLSGGGNFFW